MIAISTATAAMDRPVVRLGAATRRTRPPSTRHPRFGTLRRRTSPAAADDDAPPAQGPEDDPRSPANLMKRANAMRAKAIKVKLAAMGVGTKDLFEKEELARALAKAWGEQLEGDRDFTAETARRNAR